MKSSIKNRLRAPFGALLLLCLTVSAAPASAGGQLLIVGGALSPDNSGVHQAFVNSLRNNGPVVIIPVASGQPARSALRFSEALVRYGLDASRIEVFPLAVRDDASTEDIDEGQWSENAWNADLLAKFSDAAGFWMTGGDQLRITKALKGEDGQESPLLSLMRERLAAGAVIGGTSAGAAVMSGDMIAGGVSFTALTMPLAETASASEDEDSGRLYLDRGLGFLPTGIVDQHFDRRARLGRLVRALIETGQSKGYGIDEDTALLIDLDSGRSQVLGRGSVTLLDAANAGSNRAEGVLASGVILSLAAPGVVFDLQSFRFLEGQGNPTVGHEYYGHEPMPGGGMALPNPLLHQALGNDLLDNRASSRLDRFSVDGRGQSLVYSFVQTPSSQGYWLSGASGGRYSASAVRFDITVPRKN